MDLLPLAGLKTIEGGISVDGSAALQSLDGLNKVTSIGADKDGYSLNFRYNNAFVGVLIRYR